MGFVPRSYFRGYESEPKLAQRDQTHASRAPPPLPSEAAIQRRRKLDYLFAADTEFCGSDCPFRRLKKLEVKDDGLNDIIERTHRARLYETSCHPTLKAPHQPIRRWQTRLIRISPQQGDLPTCKLTTVDFIDMDGVGVTDTDEIVQYEALSYVWGNPEDDCVITCDGCPVRISSNLARFLYRLSERSVFKYYWCDALCINQFDPAEKAFQVRNILRIFEKATQVFAWIGISESVVHLDDVPLIYAQCKLPKSQSGDQRIRHQDECSRNLAEAQEYLRSVSALRFWARTWIRQEVFAAQHLQPILEHSVEVRRGFEETWNNIFTWLAIEPSDPSQRAAEAKDPLTDGRLGVEPHFQTMCKHFQHNGTDKHDYRPPSGRMRYSVHWLKTLQDGVSFECGDPRDRVYGVLGIITSRTTRLYVEDRPDIKPQDFPISYEKTVSEVYQDVTRFLIDTDNNLDALTVFEDRRHRAKDLPSWVSDWRVNQPRSLIGIDANRSEVQGSAGMSVMQHGTPYGELHVNGIRYLSIRSLGTIAKWPAELVEYKDSHPPHALCNTSGWLDKSILDMAYAYAMCNFRLLKDSEPFPWLFPSGVPPTRTSHISLLVPRTARMDDLIVGFAQARCLFVVRPRLEEGTYKLIGPVVGHMKAAASARPWQIMVEHVEQDWGFANGLLVCNTPHLERFMLV